MGLFHFGLTDGVYLRSGGEEWKRLNKSLLGEQLKCMNIFHTAIACLIWLISKLIFEDEQRIWVLVCAGIYLIIANEMYYLGFVFQAVNETKIHSISIIISKTLFVICILSLIFLEIKDFKVCCICFLFAHLIGTIFLMYKGREIVFSPMIYSRKTFIEMRENIRVGISLTISSVASNLVLGIGRILVDLNGGLEAFGVISLAVSLTSFVLNFLTQVSMVMFPMLRRFNIERLTEIYTYLRNLISYFLCVIYVLFIPFVALLELWLPQYVESFKYMVILFPMCVFDGKMQMLYNTYFKVLREEKTLMKINVLTVVCSACFCIIAICMVRNKFAIAFAMLLAILSRSFLSSFYLSKKMNVEYESNFIAEIVIATVFIFSNIFFADILAFGVNLIMISIYYFIERRKIRQNLTGLKIAMNIEG